MFRGIFALGILVASCRAQEGLQVVLSTLRSPSGRPVIRHLADNTQSEVSPACMADLQTYIEDLSSEIPSESRYARKMKTSFGDPPDERAEFTQCGYDYGIREQCLDVNKGDADNSPFNAHYCMAMIRTTLDVHVGTCWPNSCSERDIKVVADLITLELLNTTYPDLSFVCLAPAPWDAWSIFVLTFFSFIAAIVLVATIYDLHVRQHYIPSKTATQTSDSKGDKLTSHPDENALSKISNGAVNETYTSFPETTMSDHGTQTSSDDADDDDHDHDKKLVADDDSEVDSENTTEKVAPDEVGLNASPSPDISKLEIANDVDPQKGMSNSFVLCDGILMSFSAARNLRFLLNAKSNASSLGVLNGLRVLSMFWVIMGHAVSSIFATNKFDNYYIVYNSLGFPHMAFEEAYYSVDTFFVIGGLLVTYITLKKLSKSNGKMNWIMFYVHRYLRLTPALMGSMGLYIGLNVHLAGQGHLILSRYAYVRSVCKQYWWTYPLYITNLYPFPGNNSMSCMPWAWYLSCDMQFYIISPIIIYLLYRKRKLGLCLMVVITIISVASNIGLVWYYGINPYGDNFNDRMDGKAKDVTYTKPYTRIQAYMVGMFVGYAQYQLAGRKIKLSPLVVLIGWLIAFALGMTCVYALWRPDGYAELVQWQAILWEGLTKFAWSIAIAWVCFACINGYGGVINSFLSWNFWIPMGRLTYCTYLIHTMLCYNVLHSGKTLFHFGTLSFAYFFAGTLVFSYLAGLGLSLLTESPAIGLEKVIFGKYV